MMKTANEKKFISFLMFFTVRRKIIRQAQCDFRFFAVMFIYIFKIYLIAGFQAEYTFPAPNIFGIKSISGRKGELQHMSSSL